jgi:hypothetical protein
MDTRGSRPVAFLRLRVVALLAILAVLPFLWTPIPPLTDVPGHIGQFSIQTAPAGSTLLRYFTFHWALTLNLASDAIVQALHPVLGVIPTVWLLCAATPALTVVGIMSIARATNRRGAHALPWSLLFVFNYPFLWGFLNFALTQAFGLIALAAWIALDGRRRLRAVLFLVATPMLLIGHGVAGIATIAMIVGHAIGRHSLHRPGNWHGQALRSLVALWPPVLAAVATVIIWKASGSSEGGTTLWLFHRKTGSIISMVRDQNKVFDIGTVACCIVIWLLGRRWGARLGGGGAGAVIVIIGLFLATPSLISGSDDIDTRLAPLIPMLAFAMQDWSRVDRRRRRLILTAGFALLGARFAVTTASFVRYGQRYAAELTALRYVRPGSRVMNLSQVDCHGWRSARLEHLSNLASTFRGAWVNSHWSIEGLHLLQVRYRPSQEYYNDPSHMVFPARCIDAAVKPYADYRAAQTAVMAMPALPLEQVDYLWLVGAQLPAGYHDARLRRLWHDDISELFLIRHSPAAAAASPATTPSSPPAAR